MNASNVIMLLIMGIIIVAVGWEVVGTVHQRMCEFCANKTGVQQADDSSIDCDGVNKCCPFIQNNSIYQECLVNNQ